MPLSADARQFFEGTNFVTISTIGPDGAPESAVVWARPSGEGITFSTRRGTRKHHNIQRDPRISALAYDAANPYTYAELRGTATVVDDPGGRLLQELSLHYTGKEWPPEQAKGQVQVTITPNQVVVHR